MNSLRYARIMSRVVNTPLFCHPRAAMTFYNALCGRFGTSPGEMPETPDASLVDQRQLHQDRPLPLSSMFEGERVRSEDGHWRGVEPFMRTPEGVAIVTVTGELTNRGAWVGSDSGVTSYEGIGYQMKRAAKDRKSSSIILDVESPGGSAVGSGELASLVRSIAAEKPVYAVVNGMAASAGYSMISGATRIVTTPSGISGSIGCVLLHMDQSEAIAAMGIKPTLIHAGAHKVDGNSLGPLSDEVRADLQAEVDSFYQQFVETVAAGRGRKLSAKAARETEARTYIGQAAVDAGIADAVGSFEEVLAEATKRARRMSAASTKQRNQAMSQLGIDTNDDQGVQPQVDAAKAAAAQDQAVKAAAAEATKAAHDRMQAILGDARVQGKERAAMHLALKSPGMSADDVAAFVAENIAAAASVPGIASRVENTGVNNVSSGGQNPGAGPTGNDSDGEGNALSWGGHVDSTNRQRASLVGKR